MLDTPLSIFWPAVAFVDMITHPILVLVWLHVCMGNSSEKAQCWDAVFSK